MATELKRILRRMNLDDSFYNLGREDYADALNVTKDAQEASQDISITNIIGNRLVPYNKPAGTNAIIGAKADVLKNRVFEFIWNSNGKHSIVIYDNATRVRTKLIENLTDTNQIDVLQFGRYNKIIHCDIIYRGENEGDLLFWTDGNVSPRKCNVKHLQDGIYTYVKTPFVELAKMPPLKPIIAVYGSDTSRNANSLRKKLVMATYRWGYDDFEKSTYTTYSKVPLPIGYYGSDNDLNSTKNNFITFTVETGDKNVTEIEIIVRFNVGNDWGAFILAISLNKSQLSIPDNSTYDYLFYNDAIYPPTQIDEVVQLFDWVPKKAKSQCCGNGNTIELAAITEGYDNYPINELDVTITAQNKTNVPPDTDPPALTYVQSGFDWTFTVSGSVPTGTEYKIIALVSGSSQLFGDYVSVGGDTTNNVANGLQAYISAHFPGYAGGVSGDSFIVNPPDPGFSVLMIHVIAGTSGGGTISTEKTWLWDANYIFGLAYKDEQGRIMPGVSTFVNPVDSDNDFMVTTPSFSLNVAAVKTPVISAAINHIPPAGAVSYAWVRRRMTYSNFLFYETCDLKSDADFYYLCLANIEQYKKENSQFIYGTAPITSDSRIRIVAGITSSAYNGNLWNQDYEILGLVTKTLTGGVSPGDDRFFIKVKKPIAAPSPVYTTNMLVMVYTPMANPTDITNSVYYEWGEEYKTYRLYTIGYSGLAGIFQNGETVTGGTSGATGTIVVNDGISSMTVDSVIRAFVVGEIITGGTSSATATVSTITSQLYHRGMNQDQNGSQKATFTWIEGDVYFHQRSMYPSIVPPFSPIAFDTVNIMDSNFSDFFSSAVNDNGRGLSIEPNARETYFPATIRFSREYQQNTNINQTNRFFFNNFIDLDRSFGDIFKMSIKDRYIRIGQRFKIGAVPIFNQISKDSANNTILAATDVLLNPVQYYSGDFGVGREFPVWVEFNNSSYFFDTNRGIWCRLSLDGITPISGLYKINSWATDHGVLRTGNYNIYGAYDSKSNNCIFSFEATDADPAATISFDEENNSFESFLSYHPEFMVTLGALLITYKNGNTWTHDSELYNNFYGVQYPSTITPVFNQNAQIKKKFLSLGYRSNKVWSSPTKGDVKTSQINPQTNLQQESKILESNYEVQETATVAALNYDMNSKQDERLALYEGDYLNGDYCVIKFVCPVASASELATFNMPYLNFVTSPKTV